VFLPASAALLMPPRQINLAFAGRKLLGPPEGYDKKKELQIKRWLSSNPPPAPQNSDVAASIASVSEVCVLTN